MIIPKSILLFASSDFAAAFLGAAFFPPRPTRMTLATTVFLGFFGFLAFFFSAYAEVDEVGPQFFVKGAFCGDGVQYVGVFFLD